MTTTTAPNGFPQELWNTAITATVAFREGRMTEAAWIDVLLDVDVSPGTALKAVPQEQGAHS